MLSTVSTLRFGGAFVGQDHNLHTYAKRLFEILKENDCFDVSELQRLLGTNYKHSCDFRRYTINRSVKWIRDNLGFDISYKFVTVGNVNKYIKFYLPDNFNLPSVTDDDLNPVTLYNRLDIDIQD